MPFCSRPEYARQRLEALCCCEGIERYAILANVDPGCPTVRELVENIDFAECTPAFHRERLGVIRNVWHCLSRAFERADVVVYVEDDVLLASDALHYFEHCDRAYRGDGGLFSVTGYHRSSHCEPPRGLVEIYPLLSRVQNIGAEGGAYVPNAAWHREHQHAPLWASEIHVPTGVFREP